MHKMREEINRVNEALDMLESMVQESYEFHVDFEPADDWEIEDALENLDADSPESINVVLDLINSKYSDQAWQVIDPASGEIVLDFENEGAMQDANRSMKDRQGYPQGELDRMAREEEPEEDDWEEDDWEEDEGLTDAELRKVAEMITTVAGETFPDGDPFDLLFPKIRRIFGVDDHKVIDVLDQAARAHLGVDGYHEFLADMWDQVGGDNPEMELGQNPWKESHKPKAKMLKKSFNPDSLQEAYSKWKRKQ